MASKENPAAANGGASGFDHAAELIEQSNSANSPSAQEPVTIVIDGPAVAKGRPRMTRRGFAYTPAATRKYEAHARLAAQLAMGERAPIASPAKLALSVELPIPASWSRRRREAAMVNQVRPTSRPDLDNYVKAALDAINGIVVADDSIIVAIEAQKRYGIDPKATLTIMPLDAEPSNHGGAAK